MLQAKGISYEVESSDGETLKLLNNINFEVPKGHFMAIVGTSGCGKTTLLKAIAGMISETAGDFFWNGNSLSEEDFEPSEIGYVPQFSIAYDELTVDESVENATRLRTCFRDIDAMDDRIDKVLEETGITGIADRRVKVLSGGQKRRLSLALELVSKPSLLLCDEVTSGLDPRSEKEVVQLLHKLSRENGRIVISVTHSLAHIEQYDSILVMHQGNIVYHGSPRALGHYFGVTSLEDIYPKLSAKTGEKWNASWEKYKESYYLKLESERKEKIESGALSVPVEQEEPLPLPVGEDQDEDQSKERAEEKAAGREEVDEGKGTPGLLGQFMTLFFRRWKIFCRDRGQLALQLVMILLFPIIVALFSSKGQDPINKLSESRDQNIIAEIEQQQTVQQNHVKVGSAVSGIIMFEIILLGLMGSNMSAPQIGGARPKMEKVKYGGMRPCSYLMSKYAFLFVIVAVQSLWMYAFVDLFWPFRGDGLQHFSFLFLANAAMTSVCLGISSLAKSADQASLLSIYLVGFQLPLSGAVLALPETFEKCVRPFISAYWAWSGSITGLDTYVHNAVKIVIDTTLSPTNMCYAVLGVHILAGMVISYIGVKRAQWD